MGQQPQPAGRAISGHEAGTGGHSASFSAEQGAQRHGGGWGWEVCAAEMQSCAASRSAESSGTSGMAGRTDRKYGAGA